MVHRIFHADDIDINGTGAIRNAVRGVISDNSKLLLIHSPINGDYKFPGGGIKHFESHEKALKREIQEECGLPLSSINSLIAMIAEYDKPQEPGYDYFGMQSFYYQCKVKDQIFGKPQLDKYEADLGFTPVWVEIEKAIKTNKNLIQRESSFPRWTIRDTFFLEYLAKNPIFVGE